MDIRTLQYFLAVAREESITRAAEALHMTQPPLSRQMKELEEELGRKLFIRGSRKLSLTEEGMLLRRRAGEMVELMEKTRAELAGFDEDVGGEVCIGGGETEAMSFLTGVAARLHARHPRIRFRMYSGDAELILERLDEGLIDFGLLIGAVDVEKFDSIQLRMADSWGVFMRRDSELARKDCVRPEDLRDRPLILSQQAERNREMLAWMKAGRGGLNVVASYNLIYNALHLVREGMGYAVALDGIVDTSSDAELCFRPMRPELKASIRVTWKRYQAFSRASQAFLDELRAQLEET